MGLIVILISVPTILFLKISESYGAKSIKRPKELSNDESSSESAWLHALKKIEEISRTEQHGKDLR